MVCIYNAAPGINITYCIDYPEHPFDMHALNPKASLSKKRRMVSKPKTASIAAAVLSLAVTLPGLAAGQTGSYPQGSLCYSDSSGML